MKALFLLVFLAAAYAGLARTAPARSTVLSDTAVQPRSNQGYWVVESNRRTPNEATLYFYNSDHQLVYQEALRGVRLNLDRRRTVNRLNRVLAQATDSWDKKTTAFHSQLVARQFARQ